MTYWLIGIGGFAGSLLRYGLYRLLPTPEAGGIPMATLAVNWSGSFLLLALLTLLTGEGTGRERIRLLLGTGFLGAYTTFSTLSAELFIMLHGREWLNAVIYAAATAIGGLVFALIGYKAGLAWRKRVKPA